jgi:hypothetical protein
MFLPYRTITFEGGCSTPLKYDGLNLPYFHRKLNAFMLNFSLSPVILWIKSMEARMGRGISRLRGIFVVAASWCALCVPIASAQKLDVGIDFLTGLPQNEFRDKIRETGYGVSGHVGYFIGDLPVMVGAELGYLRYGSETHREYLSETIPEITVDVKTTNNILMFHGFARVQAQDGAVRPYVEGLFGFKYLFTRTSIQDNWYDETITSATNYDDLVGSRGFGAGVDFRLWNGNKRKNHPGVYDLSLNVSARYLWGNKASYLKKGSIIRNDDGTLTYLVYRSKTDLLTPQIGLRIRF